MAVTKRISRNPSKIKIEIKMRYFATALTEEKESIRKNIVLGLIAYKSTSKQKIKNHDEN